MPEPLIWITGADGMLGSAVEDVARKQSIAFEGTGHSQVDISDPAETRVFYRSVVPTVIINCAGVTPSVERSSTGMVRSNALGPHVLAELGVRMVHMSTDCVFGRGARGAVKLMPDSLPAPNDLYGRSKLAGESAAEHVVNVRGSFIGWGGGFLEWLMNARGEIEGWDFAFWNGTDVETMAETLLDVALAPDKFPGGVYHAASASYVSKGLMVRYFAEQLKLPVTVKSADSPGIWRVLAPSPGLILPSVHESMERLVERQHG